MQAPVRKILVPTDLSRDQAALTEYAIMLASQLQAELLFFAVLDSTAQLNLIKAHSAESSVGESDRGSAGFREGIVQDAKRILQQLVDRAQLQKVRAYGHAILSEQAKTEILREATERKADLILLGIDEHPMLWKLFFGDAYDTLLHGAPCPVLTCCTKIMAERNESPGPRT